MKSKTIAEAGSVIGIATLFDLEDLKRKLLLVDKIAVIHDVNAETDWYCRKRNPTLAADLDWLGDHNIVVRVESAAAMKDVGNLRMRFSVPPTGRGAKLYKMSSIPEALLKAPGATVEEGGGNALEALCDLFCRVLCGRMTDQEAVQAVSLCCPGATLPRLTDRSV